jgi:CRP-like cAMP-binding protein
LTNSAVCPLADSPKVKFQNEAALSPLPDGESREMSLNVMRIAFSIHMIWRDSMASNEIKNLLLAALPPNVFNAMRPDLVHVELKIRTLIYAPEDEVEWVYFPSSGMISILQRTPDSRGIELATIGKEGALGAIAGFGLNLALTASVVQMPLTAVKISAPRFRKHVAQYASLQEMALKSNEVILAHTQITAACNALHNVEQRFCRWLLQTWDRSENDTITLTQEFLGEMLGVRRTSVTEIASKIQAAGLIRYRRGHIDVLNRPELEKRSCDCFHAVRDAERSIMGIQLKK